MVETYPLLSAGVKAARNYRGKVMYIEFENASTTFGCHLLDYPLPIDGRPPCTLSWWYDPQEDIFQIEFVPLHKSFIKPSLFPRKDISFILNEEDSLFVGLRVNNASVVLQKKYLDDFDDDLNDEEPDPDYDAEEEVPVVACSFGQSFLDFV
eukprot:CAMPEP_0174262516 /NCGR_PEP_ID=MMETSP0439-20130205/13021_1 /TAXON_ID=0 /ORGANISM="Stereomyxa ramosa, Strain Chinc5" /LENGTH=151 /DNA_ID=CAMNT_0015347235 /DNA_START=212 /DNA_END=663 /DNA_ORIENTATION=-